jgi:energy-coupling factor transport system permease protein
MKPFLGEYYPAASFWHKVDPRVKLFLAAALTLPLFAVRGWEMAVLGAIFPLLWLTARLPWRLFGQVLWSFRWLLGLTIVLNLILPYNWQSPAIPSERCFLTLELLGRLTLFFGYAAWLSHTTLSGKMLEALERLLKPVTLVGAVRVDWPFTIMLALRFLPELLADWERINAIQKLRSGHNSNYMARFDRWRSLVAPAFTMSFRRAAAISIALVARGYRPGAPRSSREPLRMRFIDWGVLLLALGITVIFVIRVFG